MELITNDVAIYLKKYGYPQEIPVVYSKGDVEFTEYETSDKPVITTYMDAWLWMNNNFKGLVFHPVHYTRSEEQFWSCYFCYNSYPIYGWYDFGKSQTIEDSIIKAIDYIAKHDLLNR